MTTTAAWASQGGIISFFSRCAQIREPHSGANYFILPAQHKMNEEKSHQLLLITDSTVALRRMSVASGLEKASTPPDMVAQRSQFMPNAF
jgi:hypothetical protein